MRKDNFLTEVRKEFLTAGLPLTYTLKTAVELGDHWDDLHAEAIERGYSDQAAANFAFHEIGAPKNLARFTQSKFRHQSWFGRHPLLTFCLFPILAIALWWFLLLSLEGWATGLLSWSDNKALPEPPWEWLKLSVTFISHGSGIVLPLLFYFLAVRKSCGPRWAFLACVLVAIHNFFHIARITSPSPHDYGGFEWTYRFSPNLLTLNFLGLLLPLLVFASLYWMRRLRLQKFLQKKLK